MQMHDRLPGTGIVVDADVVPVRMMLLIQICFHVPQGIADCGSLFVGAFKIRPNVTFCDDQNMPRSYRIVIMYDKHLVIFIQKILTVFRFFAKKTHLYSPEDQSDSQQNQKPGQKITAEIPAALVKQQHHADAEQDGVAERDARTAHRKKRRDNQKQGPPSVKKKIELNETQPVDQKQSTGRDEKDSQNTSVSIIHIIASFNLFYQTSSNNTNEVSILQQIDQLTEMFDGVIGFIRRRRVTDRNRDHAGVLGGFNTRNRIFDHQTEFGIDA